MAAKTTKEGEVLGAHIRKIRTDRGLTQGQVAEQCATSIAFISNLERGVMLPGMAVLMRLAEAFDYRVSEIVKVLDRPPRTAGKSRRT